MKKEVEGYIAGISPERRPHVEALRAFVRKAVPGATEGILWKMLGFTLDGRPFVAIASHKRAI